MLERIFLISIKAFLEFSIRGALALLQENGLANARPVVSSLALQYEPHTEPHPFNMMRRRGTALFSAPILIYDSFLGCIAQLVEHWAFNLMVAGSSPAIPKPTLH